MKIVVLAAGSSPERDVSIVSGTGVCEALRSLGHQAILVDAFFGIEEMTEDFFARPFSVEEAAERMRADSGRLAEAQRERNDFFGPHVLEACRAADFVFLTLHGANGEDGRVQAVLDLMGIPYSGTDYISSANAMDKTLTKKLFLAEQVPTPQGMTVYRGRTSADEILRQMALPLIVKPECGGSSIGVTICHTKEDLERGLEDSFALEEAAIIEEFIEGKELTAAIIGDEVYPVVEIAPKEGFYDYTNKYEPGKTIEICPAPIPDEKTREIGEICRLAEKALGIRAYARYDFVMRSSDNALFCLEANTLPGMTPTSLVPLEAKTVGMSYAELCQKMIDVSMEKYEQEKKA